MRITPLIVAAAAALFTACSKPAPVTETAKPALGTFGVETAHMDDAVKPGDDFFKYANGKWLATFKMPADKARFGAFDALGDKSEADVKTVVESLAAEKPAAGTTAAKVGDMYSSWMDEAAIEARGIAPLQPYLDKINAVTRHGRRARADGHHRLRVAVRARRRGRPAGPHQVRDLGRPGRPGHARPRLLPRQGRLVREVPRGVQGLRHEDLRACSATRRRRPRPTR